MGTPPVCTKKCRAKGALRGNRLLPASRTREARRSAAHAREGYSTGIDADASAGTSRPAMTKMDAKRDVHT